MLTLPKSYLSFSQFSLWKQNKDLYRKRYYQYSPPFETPETLFGKDIAERLQNNDPALAHIPRYSHPEYKIVAQCKGVTLMGYIDSFDPEHKRFLEYKTGHQPWDAVRVAKHEQLDFYSLMIKRTEGSVHNTCMLLWMPTKKVQKCIDFDGLELCSDEYTIAFDGELQSFERTIYEYERKAIEKEIYQVAKDIAEDYSSVVGGVKRK